MTPRLVAITGPDGAGKSTLCRRVAERWGEDARVVQIWDALAGLPLVSDARDYLADLGPIARGTFLMHAVARALERGERSGAGLLVFDGYWYKYAATELALGDELALVIGPHLRVPEVTFFVDLPPEEAARRRADPSAYERGMVEGDATEAFLHFQRRARAGWARVEAEAGPWVRLDGTRPVEELADAVLARVTR